jgi:hypothetical protein
MLISTLSGYRSSQSQRLAALQVAPRWKYVEISISAQN